MVQIDINRKEITAKLVYCGPPGSGKTANLEAIYRRTPATKKGKLAAVALESASRAGSPKLFIDYMPIELGTVGGLTTKFQLYTAPGGQRSTEALREVLRGADGLVFVADSGRSAAEENRRSLADLEARLTEAKRSLSSIPLVLQWNKRDLEDPLSLAEMERGLNDLGSPSFTASASSGEGVVETLKALARLVLEAFERERKAKRG